MKSTSPVRTQSVPPRDWKRERDTTDTLVPRQGKAKSVRIDLGLELLALRSRPGVAWSSYEIAAWAGCTNAAIQAIQARALRKLRRRLGEMKGELMAALTPECVPGRPAGRGRRYD